MTRPPLLASAFVLAACGMMIGLGIWQLRRADEKAALLQQYAQAGHLPAMAFPATPDPKALPLFRTATGYCHAVTGWRAKAGRNLAGDSGWAHIADCATGAEGPGFAVEAGWSRMPASPQWAGGAVSGIITTDDAKLIRLVSAKALAPNLVPSAPPSPDLIPNNHLSYAIQWFGFAALALVIFGLALRRRGRAAEAPQNAS